MGQADPTIRIYQPRDRAAVIAFYRAIGFTQDEVVSFGKRLEVD